MGVPEHLAGAAVFALWAWGCSVEPVDIEGKECPCAASYTCDPRTNRCIIGNATGGSAGAAGTGSGGVAGSAGAPAGGGTGGASGDASLDGSSSGGSSSGGTSSDGGGVGGTVASGGGGAGTGGAGTGGTTGGKGSCVGHCDLKDEPVPGSKPPCYCDAACEGFGDCCSDKIQVCGKAPADAGAG